MMPSDHHNFAPGEEDAATNPFQVGDEDDQEMQRIADV
jgi:hypothetical protein